MGQQENHLQERPPMVYVQDSNRYIPLSELPRLMAGLAEQIKGRWYEQAEYAAKATLSADFNQKRHIQGKTVID